MLLAVASVAMVGAAAALATGAVGGNPFRDTTPTTAGTLGSAAQLATADRPAPTPPEVDWPSVRESNVLHSTRHDCETKVLAGWFRARCASRAGETLHVTAPPDAGATVTTDANATTLLVPLTGVDRTFTFDWAGGRGPRTLRVVGRPVEHRVIQSQGEFSGP